MKVRRRVRWDRFELAFLLLLYCWSMRVSFSMFCEPIKLYEYIIDLYSFPSPLVDIPTYATILEPDKADIGPPYPLHGHGMLRVPWSQESSSICSSRLDIEESLADMDVIEASSASNISQSNIL